MSMKQYVIGLIACYTITAVAGFVLGLSIHSILNCGGN